MEPHQREFDNIKEALMSDPVMAYPDWNKQFILTTDASHSGLGAVLSQQFPEGERVIAYASRRFQGLENNYPITQLEALAVVWAVELFWDPYLADKQFKLITDHRALLKFQNMQTESNRTLQRWSMKLSEHDMLKRMEEEDVLNAKIIAKNKGSTLEIKNEAPCYWVDKKKKHWQKFWCNDEGVLHQTRLINEEEVTRVCLPQKYIADALKLVHEESHWGHKTTYEKICESYLWPGMWRCKDLLCNL
jgi:hypothetical protein